MFWNWLKLIEVKLVLAACFGLMARAISGQAIIPCSGCRSRQHSEKSEIICFSDKLLLTVTLNWPGVVKFTNEIGLITSHLTFDISKGSGVAEILVVFVSHKVDCKGMWECRQWARLPVDKVCSESKVEFCHCYFYQHAFFSAASISNFQWGISLEVSVHCETFLDCGFCRMFSQRGIWSL